MVGGASRNRTDLDGFAIRCITTLPLRRQTKTKPRSLPWLCREIWSGKRVSNSRPQPWQGCALPTELFPHGSLFQDANQYNLTKQLNCFNESIDLMNIK